MAHLLGIDIGTSGTKALLINEAGKVLATHTVTYPLSTPKPGWSEQDPEHWWAGCCKAVKAVLKKAGVGKHDVAALGMSGQMHGSVFIDKAGKVLRPCLLWNDQRTAAECDEIESAAGGRKALVKLVANPALTGFTAPKILWVRKHEPRVYAKTAHILLPKDYLRWRMTGEFATEASDASGTLLFDVARRNWSGELLSKLGIDRDLLPDSFESPDVTGLLHAEGARALGLAPGTPVVGGAGDVAAGAVGNGVVSTGVYNSIIGTSGIVFAHSDEMTLDTGGVGGRVHTMCHAVPGKWCVFGCMLSGAGNFQWFADTLAAAEMKQLAAKDKSVFDALVKEAQAAPLGSEGLFFLPYLTGERCPHPDPLARAGYIGITRRTTRGHMVRALFEGVTFGMRDMLLIMRDEMKIPVKQIRGTGGGTRSALWRQIQADVLEAPLALTNSAEGGAFGVALLAGVGAGVYGSVEQACRATIKVTEQTKPVKKQAAAYAKHHAVYAKLYGSLKDRFAEIAAL
ncbi:MAG: xylulokinase [Phycisphaerae bacterium]